MAKFIPGPIVAEIRGSIGATTFARNQHGAYTRARVTPNLPRTPAQIVTRDRFAAAAAAWNSPLTDTQRLAWNAYATALRSRNGPLRGREYTGRTAFMSSFKNLDTIGVATLTDPPDQPEAGNVTALTLAADTDAQTFTVDGQVPAGTPSQGLIVLATPPMNPGRFFGWTHHKQIAALAPGWTFPLELWTEYREIFQAPGGGQAVIAFVHPVASSSGLAGVRQSARALATGSGVPVLQRITTLTNAQILTLPTTSITVVPGVAGKLIAVQLALLQLDCAAAAYTNITAAAGSHTYLDAAGRRTNSIRNDDLYTPAGIRDAILPARSKLDAIPPTNPELFTTVQLDTDLDAAALQIACINGAGNFTGGNAANSLKVTVWYELADVI